MHQNVFFSWQSDTANGVGRSFIEACLNQAVRELAADAQIDLPDREIAVDRDTLDEPGSPPITDTIFAKIDRAAVFVADMTYVAQRQDGGRSPNPNVLVEHGWALKSRTHKRVIGVMNIAYGSPDAHPLPFDLRHARWPIQFDLPEGADSPTRAAVRQKFVRTLKDAIGTILGDAELRAEALAGAPQEAHPHDVRLLRRFRKLVPEKVRLFLRDHSFGAALHKSNMDPFYELWSRWRGSEFEFHDDLVQKAFADVIVTNAAFCDLANTSLHIARNSENALTVKTDLDLSQGTQPGTIATAKALDKLATALTEAIDNFDRVARDRIRTPI